MSEPFTVKHTATPHFAPLAASLPPSLPPLPLSAPTPVPSRSGILQPKSRPLAGGLSLLVLIALWQLGSSSGFISALVAPSPLDVARALYQMAASGKLWVDLNASLVRLGAGLLIGTLSGISFGLAVGLFSAMRSPGATLVAALFPIPKIALLPMFIIWFGIDESSKIATIAFGTFFPVVVATYGAVDHVDRSFVRMGRSFALSTGAIVWKIILPGALPGILSGLRIAISIGIVLLVAAEMIGANEGLGAQVLMAGSLMQTDQLLAGVFVLSMLGLLVSTLIGLAERWLLRWR